ncbi:MAG: 2-hydroxyacyl-CoA dehydratase [Oscillospiraceae bacterium]|nr:2-hydroxyacyl-CoA dehydratase [Oscillospiraceae bacterium]
MRDNKNIIIRTPFTEEMKRTHTILMPQMLPIHFDLLAKVFRQAGYNAEVLSPSNLTAAEEGLKSVHNDTCYPALLVIGQFIDALKSGSYDPRRTALLLTQTGGGCRASNYIYLLRKALEKNGFDYVPVISLNFSGFETNGFKLNLRTLIKCVFSLVYGDFLMCLFNQCVPYEKNKGDAKKAVDRWVSALLGQMEGPLFVRVAQNYRAMLSDFQAIPMDREKQTVKVGIVGEIYVKYAPPGNNNLEEYLVGEGAEVVNSGLLDFCLYCVYNGIFDKKYYGIGGAKYYLLKAAAKYMIKKQRQMIKEIRRHGVFTPPADFSEVIESGRGYISRSVKMGEGWLLTAEMLELLHRGVENIISAQPFGCLPNHIVAKGMIRRIKDDFPHANITAIDYDPGASRINQENRIKLMLAAAQDLGFRL